MKILIITIITLISISSTGSWLNGTYIRNKVIQLPVVIAKAPAEKYKDWGAGPPVYSGQGQEEPWTWIGSVCDGGLKITASSTLASQGKASYNPANVGDDNPKTAWIPGENEFGIGEYIQINDWYLMNNSIYILDGYQSSRQTWENNTRVKKLKLSFKGKDLCTVELADKMGVQKIDLSELQNFDSPGDFKFTILEVYPGLKYKDTAISGIFTCGG